MQLWNTDCAEMPGTCFPENLGQLAGRDVTGLLSAVEELMSNIVWKIAPMDALYRGKVKMD
jgi:hypothetical protein